MIIPDTESGRGLALFTDLYELTMLQAYFERSMDAQAVFSLFVRGLPPTRNFLVACGLDTLLKQLETLSFSAEDLDYLASLGMFSTRFIDRLSEFRFTGDVYAVPEGTPVFADEPILEVSAPLPEAQLIETLVMNQVQLQTVLASKAMRVVTAAAGRPVVDFGARRMHGLDAAIKAVRAFHIAGVAGTSNVLAGRLYGVPVRGTMAHSYVQAHVSEQTAFEVFARLYPDTVLLVDTVDTLKGVGRVIELARRIGDRFRVSAVRLDSGNLDRLSREARRLLDDAGLDQVGIFGSGGLDEHAVHALVAAGAPVDGFGVGTSMGVSSDAPALDIVYKLAEYAGEGRLKLSSGKPILPGRKQVFRREKDGRYAGDIIGRADEELPGRPLLRHMMAGGRRTAELEPDLDVLRRQAREQFERLPAEVRGLEPAVPGYRVEASEALRRYQADIERILIERNT